MIISNFASETERKLAAILWLTLFSPKSYKNNEFKFSFFKTHLGF